MNNKIAMTTRNGYKTQMKWLARYVEKEMVKGPWKGIVFYEPELMREDYRDPWTRLFNNNGGILLAAKFDSLRGDL